MVIFASVLMNAPSVVVASLNPCPAPRPQRRSSRGLGAAGGGSSPFGLQEPRAGASLQDEAFLHPLSKMAAKGKELWAPSVTSASLAGAQGQTLTGRNLPVPGQGCRSAALSAGEGVWENGGGGEGQ